MENRDLWGDIMAKLAMNNINLLGMSDKYVEFEYQWRTRSGVAKWSKVVKPYAKQGSSSQSFQDAIAALGREGEALSEEEEKAANVLALIYDVRYIRSQVEGE